MADIADIDAYVEAIKKLRTVGVVDFKCAAFEVTLGYPFGEAPKPEMREGGTVTPAQPVTNAADLVLYPPDLTKIVEDR